MFRFALICVISLGLGFSLQAQTILQPKEVGNEPKGVIYNQERVFDFYLHTRGFGLGAKFGVIHTYYLTKYYHIELGNIRHPKEYKPTGPANYLNLLSKPYVYGKQNSFFVVRGGMGAKRYLSEKAKRKGVAVGVNYQAGPSLGFLKPYYLDLRQPSDGLKRTVMAEKFTEDNADRFLDQNFIEGASGFTKGLGDIRIVPGAHLKAGLHFAWGAYDQFAKALELGLMVDFYFQKIEIMVIENNKPYFLNLYVNLQIGKRK